MSEITSSNSLLGDVSSIVRDMDRPGSGPPASFSSIPTRCGVHFILFRQPASCLHVPSSYPTQSRTGKHEASGSAHPLRTVSPHHERAHGRTCPTRLVPNGFKRYSCQVRRLIPRQSLRLFRRKKNPDHLDRAKLNLKILQIRKSGRLR